MNMMEMMNQAKGWGAKATEAPAKADDWYNMQSQEDYEAYLKWCEENRARTAEFQKHKYYYMVTFEFLKFCRCSDFTAEIERFFMHEGVSTSYEEFELADLGAIDSSDPNAVAQALVQLSKGEQIKSFFGGLANAMCAGARTYFEQVEAWEKQYNFLERLV